MDEFLNLCFSYVWAEFRHPQYIDDADAQEVLALFNNNNSNNDDNDNDSDLGKLRPLKFLKFDQEEEGEEETTLSQSEVTVRLKHMLRIVGACTNAQSGRYCQVGLHFSSPSSPLSLSAASSSSSSSLSFSSASSLCLFASSPVMIVFCVDPEASLYSAVG